ncbi:hypothetical protein FRB99_001804 [Tulasnella sp. 403]|nr:hypothetical protein FRB99_001804 [Tulasnella sp. 403]
MAPHQIQDNSGIKNKIKDLLNVPENIVSHWKETTYDPIIKPKVQNLPYEAGMRAIRYNPLASAEKKAFNMFSKYKSTTPMKEWRQMLNMAREGKLDPSSAKAADSELQKAAQKLLVDKLGEKSGLLAKESWLKDFLAASEKIV